jgi:serine/threonine-protein kinase RsbW
LAWPFIIAANSWQYSHTILGLRDGENQANQSGNWGEEPRSHLMHPHRKDHQAHAKMVDLASEPHALKTQVHSPAELGLFFEMLEIWMRALAYSRKDIFAVRLALYEAINNAFLHGNRSDRSKTIYVRYLVTAADVLLEVEDEGPGFDPHQVPDPITEPCLDRPGGRGLFLMGSYMTWISFNPLGNRVTLCRQRS